MDNAFALPKSSLRVPPNSLEAEQAVLGSLLLNGSSFESISSIVSENDFYMVNHCKIFKAIASLVRNNHPIDILSLSEELEKTKSLGIVGGIAYLGGLAKNTPTSANIVFYAHLVKEKSILRRFIQIGTDIVSQGYEPGLTPIPTLLDEAEKKVFDIGSARVEKREPQLAVNLLVDLVGKLDECILNQTPLNQGTKTGFHEFDELTGGLQKSELIIIAGRPSMGKTTLAINIAENVCLSNQGTVLVFSMEMPASSLVFRMLSSLGRINQKRLRMGNLTDDDWTQVSHAMALMADKPFVIDDSSSLTPFEVRTAARRIAKKHGSLDLIVIDYLQLMRIPGYDGNRNTEISEISRSLKALAGELNVPIIVLSQLNRGLENRVDKRPVMSDLRESGAIEQDADLILFIYRDEVYNKDNFQNKGNAEIILSKHRNGEIGTFNLMFAGQFSRFDNLPKELSMIGR